MEQARQAVEEEKQACARQLDQQQESFRQKSREQAAQLMKNVEERGRSLDLRFQELEEKKLAQRQQLAAERQRQRDYARAEQARLAESSRHVAESIRELRQQLAQVDSLQVTFDDPGTVTLGDTTFTGITYTAAANGMQTSQTMLLKKVDDTMCLIVLGYIDPAQYEPLLSCFTPLEAV